MYNGYEFLMPVTEDEANINAIVKPFQWEV